jgi:nitroreductase
MMETDSAGGGVMDVIARRVSCRAYRKDPVPEATIRGVLEAARLAPSACNRQPWRFAVATDAATRRRIVEEGFLPGLGMTWALEAPVHIVLGMERSIVTHVLGASVSGVDYPWIDLGIAGEHLVLAATAAGLGTCWIGWIQSAPLRRIAGWKRSIRPVAVITVGWPLAPGSRPPPAERRVPLDDLVTWLR